MVTRVAVRGCAVGVVASLAFIPASSLAAPNPRNHGHHYGQIKHHHHHPAPAPPPVTPPGPVHHPPRHSPPVGNAPAIKLTPAAVTVPPAGVGFPPFFIPPLNVGPGTQAPDRNLWVVEALLPALLVIWLLLLAASRSFRMRPAEASAG